MKRLTIIVLVILAALVTMAPSNERAEKLRYNDNGWEIVGSPGLDQLTVEMSAKFGIATAGEHAGFTAKVSAMLYDQHVRDMVLVSDTVEIKKVADIKDADGFISISPAVLEWNGDDDGTGFPTDIRLDLISPSGNVMSTTVAENVQIKPPDCGEVGCP